MKICISALLLSLAVYALHAEEVTHPELFRIQTSTESAKQLSAHSFLGLAFSHFSPDTELAVGRIFLLIGEETVNLEFFDVSKSEICMDSFRIALNPTALFLDDEEMPLESFLQRMTKYAETAQLTDSTPGIYFSVSKDLTLERFFQVASAMASTGVSRILFSSHENQRTEQGVVANPPPLRVGTPHKIQPEDLFRTGAP